MQMPPPHQGTSMTTEANEAEATNQPQYVVVDSINDGVFTVVQEWRLGRSIGCEARVLGMGAHAGDE
jgi:hypothetical protein